MMGIPLEEKRISMEIDKIRKTLNLACNSHPLFSVNESNLNEA